MSETTLPRHPHIVANRRIYVASSWRNVIQPSIVMRLRSAGHEVYDFHEPTPGKNGFKWQDVSDFTLPDKVGEYISAVQTQIARDAFALDKQALDWCDTCIMVLPCGRSAHLEAGYAAGQGKDVYFLLSEHGFEPELMYLLGTAHETSIEKIIDMLNTRQPYDVARFHELNGGHFERPSGHVLRMLRETIELCVAAGATQHEICSDVVNELDKAHRRKEFGGNPSKVAEEWADVALLLEVFRRYAGIDGHEEMRKKLDVCWKRRWMANKDGVLFRPRIKTWSPTT